MKKFLISFSFACVPLIFGRCDDKNNMKSVIKLTPYRYVFTVSGGEETFALTSTMEWS